MRRCPAVSGRGRGSSSTRGPPGCSRRCRTRRPRAIRRWRWPAGATPRSTRRSRRSPTDDLGREPPMDTFKTPGVYVQEIATLPPSVAEVATAIPAFLGYTERGAGEVARLGGMLEFQARFGGARPSEGAVSATTDPQTGAVSVALGSPTDKDVPKSLLYYCLNHYFLNGGGPCWVISVGAFDKTA